MTHLKDIEFGLTSAQEEARRNPSLLVDGFIDIGDIQEKTERGRAFLLLGYKGSGKSAVAERLRLLSDGQSQRFVKSVNLGDLPYSRIAKMVRGDIEPESKYPTAWKLIILLQTLDSLSEDAYASFSSPQYFEESVRFLRGIGLIPNADIKNIVNTVSQKTFQFKIPKVFSALRNSNYLNEVSNIGDFSDHLLETVCSCNTESTHFLVFDGLDEILTKRKNQFEAIGGLIFEAYRLNNAFADRGIPVRIVVLCRTDIFERVSAPNRNKIRQDAAYHFNWYSDPSKPRESLLVSIVNKRATLSLGRECDVFSEFFPKRGRRKSGLTKEILGMTRFTPRDVISLMNYIQKTVSGENVSLDEVYNGMRLYSIEYFIPELHDEMDGYINLDLFNEFISVLSDFGKREFHISELKDFSKNNSSFKELDDIEEVCRLLYGCSAVGHVEKNEAGADKFQFRFRNPYGRFNPGNRIRLHKGMWQGLNLRG